MKKYPISFHTLRVKANEAQLEYISQQEEETPASIICFEKWRHLSARKTMQTDFKHFFSGLNRISFTTTFSSNI